MGGGGGAICAWMCACLWLVIAHHRVQEPLLNRRVQEVLSRDCTYCKYPAANDHPFYLIDYYLTIGI